MGFWWCSGSVWCSVGAQKHEGLKKYMLLASWNSSYLLKFSLTSYSPYRLISAFRFNLRPLQIVSNVSSCQKTWVLKKPKSLACLEVELLLEVLLDLLQPIQAVLSLQVNLRPLEIVPNDSPYPKTWGLKKNQVSSLLGSRVTPRRCP